MYNYDIVHMHLYEFNNIKNYKNFLTLILEISLLTLFLITLVIECEKQLLPKFLTL